MNKILSILVFLAVLLFAITTVSADKVVVIPLGGGSKGALIDKSCQDPMPTKDSNGAWTFPLFCSTKIVFLSSISYTGNLGGVVGADAKCNNLASDAGLKGNFKAWLSDSTGSPSTSFTKSTYVYRLPDGNIIAHDWTDLTDGSIVNKINKCEDGSSYTKEYVWSNTQPNGVRENSVDSCDNWTTESDTSMGRFATPQHNTNSLWSLDTSDDGCNYSKHIICFQQ